MPSSKVYLTYKRKLPLSRTGIAHQNGCHNSLSEGPSDTDVTAPDKHDAPVDEHKSENQQRNSLPTCCNAKTAINLIIRSALIGCLRESVSCGCKLQDSSVLQPIQKSSRLETMKHTGGPDKKLMTVSSCKSPVVGILGEGTSGKDTEAHSYLDISLKSKLHHVQVNSCSVMNVDSEEKLISQSTGINTRASLDFISSKSSLEGSCNAVCDTGSCFLKASNLEGTGTNSKDKSTDSTGCLHGPTKLNGLNNVPVGAPLGSLQISLNDAAKDPCEARVTDTELVNTKCQGESEILSSDGAKATIVPDYTKKESNLIWICLLLLFIHSALFADSCGTLDHDVNLDLGSQKEPAHGASESLRGSMDSTSRSHATVLDRMSPSELLQGKNKRVEEVSTVHSTRLFSEEKGNSFHLAITKPEVTASMVLDESKSLHFGSDYNQMRQTSFGSLLDLGLSLPTEPNTDHSYSKKRSITSPIWNSDCKIRDFVQDALPQSSSNHAASLLRHKLMLDSIVTQAIALNAKGAFQDKFKSYTMWSEEELDSLWIDWNLERDATEETRLSLGDVYAHRTNSSSKRRRANLLGVESNDIKQQRRPATYPRNASYPDFQGNLPHWLREAVNTPPRPMEATLLPDFSSIAHSGANRFFKPYPDPRELHFSGMMTRIDEDFSGIRANELQPSGSAHHYNVSLGMRHGNSDMCSSKGLVNKPDNLIIIDSDASSEETISDDHSARP
ncbi:hypothetical protein GH714_026667 [Hevea brasiliensis]|uniref:Uncharacterized protein n=1 Tax=Hevea brasiliensis TaxID=3981 RepID=A0A6A6M5W8_HEVBR|nr:hypothetical protein GH714_026667 [Hevea brasiliensis]